jgi:IS4 transposase
MERMIDPDKLYVMDRGYAKFTLFNKIVACNSSYVCRLRDNSKYQVTKRRELSDEAKEARVLEDLEVEFGATSNSESKPDHPMRLVTIEIKPHVKKTKYKGGKSGHNSDGILRIGTNLMDVPAEAIALIYHYRWTIEIFFSLLQTHAGLSPPHQPPSQRYRDPMLLRDHWMHAD